VKEWESEMEMPLGEDLDCARALAVVLGLDEDLVLQLAEFRYVSREAERERCARIVAGSQDFDTSDSAAQVAIKAGVTKALAAAIRARR
jgi:hypothetical protein